MTAAVAATTMTAAVAATTMAAAVVAATTTAAAAATTLAAAISATTMAGRDWSGDFNLKRRPLAFHLQYIFTKGGRFCKTQTRNFADLNNLLDLRTFHKCDPLLICDLRTQFW
jgi:hypothetical protein